MNYTPDWVAGISIGAINAALIAGNPPERRVERLREFWQGVSSFPFTPSLPPLADARRRRARCRQRNQRHDRHALRRRRLLLAARSGGAVPAARNAGGDQLLRHRAAARVARAPGRLRSAQLGRGPAFGRRGQRHARQLLLLRHERAAPRRASRHGERRAAAGLSADRDRRRVLLGRRPRLEHAAAVRARRAGQPAAAGVPGRPVRRARRDAGEPGRSERAREGHPLLEPHAAEHHLRAAPAGDGPGGAAAPRPPAARACATIPTPSCSPRSRARRRSTSST